MELLKHYYDREAKKITTLNRVQAFKLSGEYIKNIRVNSFLSLYKNGYYPNDIFTMI